MKKLYTILITFLFALSVSAQIKLAKIDDKIGYANIYNGKGTNYKVIGTIDNNELFYCEIIDTSDWYKIMTFRLKTYGKEEDNYVHKSKITIIDQLSLPDQEVLIEKILIKQKKLAETFLSTVKKYNKTDLLWNSKNDSNNYIKAVSELQLYSDIAYSPILDVLSQYFCKTKDKKIIQLFLNVLWADRGSANETPINTITDCFVCESDLIISFLKNMNNQEKKDVILNDIEGGLIWHFDIDEDKEPTNQNYLELNNKLKIIK